MKKLPFYTHGGFFHAVEVTAYAICELAGVCEKFTRLTSLEDIPQDGIIADIGREYDPDNLKFDHHQGLICREVEIKGVSFAIKGIPYASAGMTWDHFGLQCTANLMPQLAGQSAKVRAIVQRVDETLIQGIDAHDADSAYRVTATCSSGNVRPITISNIIAGMNTDDISNAAEQDKAFIAASDLMQSILKSHIRQAGKFMEACDMFDTVATIQEQVITLSEGLPWKEIVHERHPKALFVISPSNHPGNPWSMIAVPVDPESREVKKPIERPEWFSGFIHQGKWIAGGSSLEELLRLAEWNISLG